MNGRSYLAPGWMAITAAALTLPMIVLAIVLDILARKNPDLAVVFLLPWMVVSVVQAFCGLYALWRFKTLLNERHGFHEVDGLIVAIIIGACVLTLIALSGRIALVLLGVKPIAALLAVPLLLLSGLALAILSIAFAVKLLRLESDLGGLLKPFAYLTLAAAVCLGSFLLAPVGLLLDAASNVILGMIFLRRETPPPAPDFV